MATDADSNHSIVGICPDDMALENHWGSTELIEYQFLVFALPFNICLIILVLRIETHSY